MQKTPAFWIGAALAGVTVSLLLVGVVSGTPVRHAIQIAPAVFAAIAVGRRTPWASYAALAIFLFWLVIMSFIWLFLAGIANITTGRFSATEIVLTIVIGLSCIAGIAAWWSSASLARVSARASAFVVFAAVQVAAMWLSLQPGFETR